VLHAPAQAPLGDLVPFVKGFTLFFWATATWWIPLLAILELWRHGLRHMRLRYEVDDWDIVFPLGMYTVGTHALGQALNLDLLQPVSDIGVYISLLAWLLVAAGALLHWRRASGNAQLATGRPNQSWALAWSTRMRLSACRTCPSPRNTKRSIVSASVPIGP